MYFGQDMDGNAEFEHLQLSRLRYGLVVERHPRHVAQGQDERQQQDAQEYHAIEAEEALAPQHQYVWQVEHRQHDSGLYGI